MNKLTLPTLYQKKKTSIVEWTVCAIENSDGAFLRKAHGQVDGAITVSDKAIYGKNIGKANETSPYTQAISEANSAWKKKLDKGYTKERSGKVKILLPMLAQDFHKAGHRIKYPAYIQPKLNGVRCLATRTGDKIEFISRGGKSYNATLKHLIAPLVKIIPDGATFDGEIYIHGYSLQAISRLVKKYRPGESEALQYWVYDVVQPGVAFGERNNLLEQSFYRTNFKETIRVHTHMVFNKHELVRDHNQFVFTGYEGLIVRNAEAPYMINDRTHHLQKYKTFQEKEVTIVGGKSAEGIEEGCVIFEVEDENKNRFRSRPRGTHDFRRALMAKLPELIGKPYTIRFFELSDNGVPLQNVGICIRDYE